MSSDLLKLVSDTLSFIREDNHIIVTAPIPKKPVVVAAPPKPVSVAPLPKPEPAPTQKQELPSLLAKIQKHLPHLKLIQTIPAMRQVALVVFNKEDLPFLNNLKNAIEKHHCPVKLIESPDKDWDQYVLVITQKDVRAKRQIVLESIATYQNNTEQKKLLWSSICNLLLLKSS